MNFQNAWPTLIGTLGGVLITDFLGLVTAYLSHRWQIQHLEHERKLASDGEIRSSRRETYAKYIVSSQKVFGRAYDLYVANRDHPVAPGTVILDPPVDLTLPSSVTNRSELRRC